MPSVRLPTGSKMACQTKETNFTMRFLALHTEKTAVIDFRKPPSKVKGKGIGTFDFLGFTHYWGKSRRGNWVIKRKTIRKRLRRAIKSLWQWCKQNRHLPVKEQHRMLCLKLRGHYQYYGIRSNYHQLEKVMKQARKGWRYWLNRRSRQQDTNWERFTEVIKQFPLPRPRIVHAI